MNGSVDNFEITFTNNVDNPYVPPRYWKDLLPDALDRVRKALNIKEPIRVFRGVPSPSEYESQVQGYPKEFGAVHTQNWNGTHIIYVSETLTPWSASEALWHEAVHAAQAEMFPTPEAFKFSYANLSVKRGYDKNPFEIEAYSVGPQLHKRYGNLFA